MQKRNSALMTALVHGKSGRVGVEGRLHRPGCATIMSYLFPTDEMSLDECRAQVKAGLHEADRDRARAMPAV